MSEQSQADAPTVCPSCGADLPANATFCGACGSLVVLAQTDTIESLTKVPVGAATIPPDSLPGEDTAPPAEPEVASVAAADTPVADDPAAERAATQVQQNGHFSLGRLFHRD